MVSPCIFLPRKRRILGRIRAGEHSRQTRERILRCRRPNVVCANLEMKSYPTKSNKILKSLGADIFRKSNKPRQNLG